MGGGGPKAFQKSRSHLQILNRRVTLCKFETDDPRDSGVTHDYVIWHSLPGAWEPLRTVWMWGAGGNSVITLKIFGATNSGEQWRCIGIRLYSTSKHHLFQTWWYPHYVIFPGFGARHLVQKAILFHIQLAIFVWDSRRWKLKILIWQGRSVNWRPSHSLSQHKILFTRYLYPCSVPQLNILQFQYEIRGNKSHRRRSWR